MADVDDGDIGVDRGGVGVVRDGVGIGAVTDDRDTDADRLAPEVTLPGLPSTVLAHAVAMEIVASSASASRE